MDGGCYIAVFRLGKARTVRVGRLGRFRFETGVYLYVGSAQRNLAKRLERHARRRKPRQWHIDYLSQYAEMIGAVLVAGPKQSECEIAAELARTHQRVAPGFGASDCRCPGHLFYTPEL